MYNINKYDLDWPSCQGLIQFLIHKLYVLEAAAFSFFSKFGLVRFQLSFGAPFVNSFDVIFINSSLMTSNDAFVKRRVLRFVVKYLVLDFYSTSLLQTIQVYWCESSSDSLHTQNLN